jgi:hypothetical protein
VERKHYLLKKLNVVESSMSHKDISRNFLLQYKLTGSEAEQAHAMGQNCTLGARALTLGDLSSADGSVVGKLGCPMANRVFGMER